MPTRLARLLLPCAFAFLVAGVAGADGSKPGSPAAAKPKAAATKAAASLSELNAGFDEREQEAQKALRRERWTAIETYVKGNGSAKDVEAGRKMLVDLAAELEDWTRTVSSADAFLAAHAASPAKIEVKVTRANALANLGKDEEAKAAYEETTKALDKEKDGLQAAFAVWSGYADHLVTMGDIEGAKKAYETCKATCEHPQVNQIMDAHLANLQKIGTEATAFPETAKDLDGKAVQVGDFKDKVLLIDFWATWCGPCRAEMPHVSEAYAKYHDRGFEVLGVTLDRPGDAEKVREYITSHDMPWRQVYYPDGPNEVAETYGVESIPHTVLVGRDGKIVRIGVSGSGLARALEKVLGPAK